MEEVAKLNDSVFEAIQSLGTGVGFTPEVQQMAKTQVQMTMKAMGKSPRLSKLFEKIESYQGKYIASHSTVTGYLACAIASQMKWGSDTTFHKLTLAAFLHDITLTNHDLAACKTLDEVQKDERFSDAERKSFKAHPMQGAEVARQFNEVPPDVDLIIAQHHERPDGSGFPRSLSSTYIAPLTAIFIVAHDMAQLAVAEGPKFKVENFLHRPTTITSPASSAKSSRPLSSWSSGRLCAAGIRIEAPLKQWRQITYGTFERRHGRAGIQPGGDARSKSIAV